jgi:protein N-terminal methyltransferase
MAYRTPEALADADALNNDEEYVEIISKLTTSLQEKGYPICGRNAEGDMTYESVDDLWQRVCYGNDTMEWYETAARYWHVQVPSTVDGMLGGYESISEIDLSASKEFLTRLLLAPTKPSWFDTATATPADPKKPKLYCCDIGAGIGRVTKGLLLPLEIFHQCDLVEGSSVHLRAAPSYLGDASNKCRFFCADLQEWDPPTCKYHLIWIQWVICYLTDVDCFKFLRRCADALCDDGILCMKENTCSSITATPASSTTTIQKDKGEYATTTTTATTCTTTTTSQEAFVVDLEDASLARSVPYLTCLAEQAGFTVIHMEYQTDFPEELFVVPMIAFQKKK